MNSVYAQSPMARGLAAQPTPINEVKELKDHNGDKWCLKDGLCRNKSHPNYYNGAEKVSQQGWHNQRTGEVHHGSMHTDVGGLSRPVTGPMGETPRYTHISHYDTAPEKKIAAEE